MSGSSYQAMRASPKRHRGQESQDSLLNAIASTRHHKTAKTSSDDTTSGSPAGTKKQRLYNEPRPDPHESARFQSFQFPRKTPSPTSAASSSVAAVAALQDAPPRPATSSRKTPSSHVPRSLSRSSRLLQQACNMSVVPLPPSTELCFCGAPVEEDSMYCGTACARQDALKALNGDADISSRQKEAEHRAKEERFRRAEEAIRAKQAAKDKLKERERERAARLAKWKNVVKQNSISKAARNAAAAVEEQHVRNESTASSIAHSSTPSLSTSVSSSCDDTAPSEVPTTPDSPTFAVHDVADNVICYPATPTPGEPANAALDAASSSSYLATEDIYNAYLLRTPTLADEQAHDSGSSSSTSKLTPTTAHHLATPATRAASALKAISLVSPCPRSDSLRYDHHRRLPERQSSQRQNQTSLFHGQEDTIRFYDSGDDDDGHSGPHDRFSPTGLSRVHASVESSKHYYHHQQHHVRSQSSSSSSRSDSRSGGHTRGKLSFDDVVGILSG